MFPFDDMSHVAGRFAHALMMLAELIPYSDSDVLPSPVRIACLEDWFTNHRMLIEFLVIGTPNNCASAQDFIPGWRPATTRETAQLRADYGFASEHVSHIGLPRPSALAQNVTPAVLAMKASFLLDVAQEFADALEGAAHPLADMVRTGVTTARNRLVRTY
jgi:hypothetical protein